jgi:hypothetical protein
MLVWIRSPWQSHSASSGMTSRWCSMDVRHASTVPLIRITPLLNDRTMRPEMTTPHALQHRRAFIDVHVVGDTTIIPGMPGTKIRISKVVLTAGGAAVITLKEGNVLDLLIRFLDWSRKFITIHE